MSQLFSTTAQTLSREKAVLQQAIFEVELQIVTEVRRHEDTFNATQREELENVWNEFKNLKKASTLAKKDYQFNGIKTQVLKVQGIINKMLVFG